MISWRAITMPYDYSSHQSVVTIYSTFFLCTPSHRARHRYFSYTLTPELPLSLSLAVPILNALAIFIYILKDPETLFKQPENHKPRF